MKALAFMALGMFMFSAADTQAKFLTADFHAIQIVWTRQLGLVAGVIILFLLRGPAIMRTAHPWLQTLRGALAACSATLFIVAVAFVPLADAVAISFVAPFVVTLMGALLLKEKVGIRRWSAVIIGFLGTLIVIRPGMGAMHPAGALILVAATMFAFRQVLSRHLASSDRTETTVAYTAIVAIALISLPLPAVWVTPQTTQQVLLFFGLACCAATGEYMVIKALEIGQAVVLAPVQYSLLLYGTIYGYLVFHQLPDVWTWIGSAIIVATGLYTLHRERVVSRERKLKDA